MSDRDLISRADALEVIRQSGAALAHCVELGDAIRALPAAGPDPVAEAALELADLIERFDTTCTSDTWWDICLFPRSDADDLPDEPWPPEGSILEAIKRYRALRQISREGAGTPDTDTGSRAKEGTCPSCRRCGPGGLMADGTVRWGGLCAPCVPEVAAVPCGGRPGEPGLRHSVRCRKPCTWPSFTRCQPCPGCPDCEGGSDATQ